MRHAVSIYPRFAVVVVLLLVLLASPRLAWPDWARNALVAMLVVLMAAHAANVARHYSAFGREVADFEHAAAASPPGKRMGGLVFDAESRVMNIEGIYAGVPVSYVIERPAPASFTWLFYCVDPQLPCRRRDPDRLPPMPHFSYPATFDAARALEEIDLFFVRGGLPAERIFGGELPRVRLIAEEGTWRVFARR